MSTLKNVGNKIFKTELATQKVELNVVQDLNDLYNKAVVISKGQVNKINDISNSLDSAKKIFFECIKVSKDVEIKAKDLGANDIVKEMQDINKFAQEYMKSLESANSQLSNIKSKL